MQVVERLPRGLTRDETGALVDPLGSELLGSGFDYPLQLNGRGLALEALIDAIQV